MSTSEKEGPQTMSAMDQLEPAGRKVIEDMMSRYEADIRADERNQARAEIERLRAEVERLRAALASAAAAMGEVLTRPVPKSAPNLPPSHVHS